MNFDPRNKIDKSVILNTGKFSNCSLLNLAKPGTQGIKYKTLLQASLPPFFPFSSHLPIYLFTVIQLFLYLSCDCENCSSNMDFYWKNSAKGPESSSPCC